jgi:hypothetical protein
MQVKMKGTQFDPDLGAIFLDREEKFLNIRDSYRD